MLLGALAATRLLPMTAADFERVLDEVLRPPIAAARQAGQGFARAAAIVRDARQRLLADEKGEEAIVSRR